MENHNNNTPEQIRGIIMTNDINSSDDLDMEIVNEDDLVFLRQKKKKIKTYFDGGTYLDNHPHFRDGWTKKDWDFYAGLVKIKVLRKNKRGITPVLDDIVEFRMLPTKEANQLCQWLFDNDFTFVVYEGDEIRRKNNDSQ